ncbi:hypothetical protein BDV96DRAFT_39680 [Lophiotrema nucula]|uniref:Uncharacterized protein n=1 Tax=Lophiotrema nucula TaxID=690887 RepID=A0A6A5ZCN0_9PLEO|nr:hypothetical protein BDV96DRAFT_39680 [Lophiotrema nucula]
MAGSLLLFPHWYGFGSSYTYSRRDPSKPKSLASAKINECATESATPTEYLTSNPSSALDVQPTQASNLDAYEFYVDEMVSYFKKRFEDLDDGVEANSQSIKAIDARLKKMEEAARARSKLSINVASIACGLVIMYVWRKELGIIARSTTAGFKLGIEKVKQHCMDTSMPENKSQSARRSTKPRSNQDSYKSSIMWKTIEWVFGTRDVEVPASASAAGNGNTGLGKNWTPGDDHWPTLVVFDQSGGDETWSTSDDSEYDTAGSSDDETDSVSS